VVYTLLLASVDLTNVISSLIIICGCLIKYPASLSDQTNSCSYISAASNIDSGRFPDLTFPQVLQYSVISLAKSCAQFITSAFNVQTTIFSFIVYVLATDFHKSVSTRFYSFYDYLSVIDEYKQVKATLDKMNKVNSSIMVWMILQGITNFSRYLSIVLTPNSLDLQSKITVGARCSMFFVSLVLAAEANSKVSFMTQLHN